MLLSSLVIGLKLICTGGLAIICLAYLVLVCWLGDLIILNYTLYRRRQVGYTLQQTINLFSPGRWQFRRAYRNLAITGGGLSLTAAGLLGLILLLFSLKP